jgi:localization factor PodJL
MNKALPWNVNGVGFDARDAAREAAHRQGKSLGEWLHGVIADHAADLGVDERDMGGQQRINAVTSKLERLSARSSDHDRRVRLGRGSDFTRRRMTPDRGDGMDDSEPSEKDFAGAERSAADTEARQRRETPSAETTESLLEEAIKAMERRAIRAEQHTENALQSFTKLLERNEAERHKERDSVTILAQKLSDIEARLTNRFAQSDDNPIKGALARLEARLDTIGRRPTVDPSPSPESAPISQGPTAETYRRIDEMRSRAPQAEPAESAQSVENSNPDTPAATGPHRPYHRLEAKLNSILRDPNSAVGRRAARPSAEAPIIPADTKLEPKHHHRLEAKLNTVLGQGQPDPSEGQLDQAPESSPGHERRLGKAIAEITRRQRMLDALPPEEAPRPESPAVDQAAPLTANIEQVVVEQPQAERGLEAKQFAAMQTEIATLATTIENLRRDVVEHRESLASAAVDPDRAAADAARDRSQALASEQIGALETVVRDLSQKIEAVNVPGASTEAFDALQQQVSLLAERFERSEDGLGKLSALEKSMRDLFTHLEDTRAAVEASAAQAAREALRIAMEEGRIQNDVAMATSLATIQALQDEAEARTNSTLSAVHGTLEKVVDRLTAMESDIADARKPHVAAPPTARKTRETASFNKIQESILEQVLGHRPGEAASHPETSGSVEPNVAPVAKEAAVKETTKPAKDTVKAAKSDKDTKVAGPDEDTGRADFIAAARRAAQVAQKDLADLKPAKAAASTRAGLAAQSKNYVARNKRPALLGLAALFVIAGTMAVIRNAGFTESDSQSAGLASTAQVADVGDPATSNRANQSSAPATATPSSASPAAMPSEATAKGAVPSQTAATDPIQTGSVPALPSFAAGVMPRPKPSIPVALKTMAEAGYGAAEYALGVRYADGTSVPRDFAIAAQWYQKAAEQNVAPAQYRLASLYEKGLGVSQDKVKAKALYLKAAEAGNPRAMHNLAVLLADGDGKPDYDSAATWFRKAAQFGVHDSQYNLAILLARGIGVKQSLVQSYQWFAIAAAQGDVDAAKKRDEVGTKLRPSDIAVAQALAASFKPHDADVAATEVQPPPGGWDGASTASPLNSARPKISSL